MRFSTLESMLLVGLAAAIVLGAWVISRHVKAAREAKKASSQKRQMDALVLRDPPSASEEPDNLQPNIETKSSSGRQLARRDEMGIIGISSQQQHALVLAEKKAQRSEDIARRAREWINNRGANLQKYDQIDTTGFKGKQNHKLLPR